MIKQNYSRIIIKIGVVLMCISLILTWGVFSESEKGHLTTGVKAASDIIYFPQQNYYVDEDAGEIVITVHRIREAKFYINANYSTMDGTAIAGQDYISCSGEISMSVWLTTEITIPILDNVKADGDKSFTIMLEGEYTTHDPQNGYYKNCTVNIIDNEEAASADNELLGLECNNGSIKPNFDSLTSEYSIYFENYVSSTKVMATVLDNTAVISINDMPCESEKWSQPIALVQGKNIVEIKVEAQNGDLRFYYLFIYRDIVPIVSFESGGFSSISGNTIKNDKNIHFEVIHWIKVEDMSFNGYGWRLNTQIGEYIINNSIKDSSTPGQEYLEIQIPARPCLNDIKIIGITYPDGSNINTDIPIDIVDLVLKDSYLNGQIYENNLGERGEYTITMKISLSIPSWLPKGTIIITENDGGRFNCQQDNLGNNSMSLTGMEGIQLFSGEYSLEINYTIERIL